MVNRLSARNDAEEPSGDVIAGQHAGGARRVTIADALPLLASPRRASRKMASNRGRLGFSPFIGRR